SLQTVGMVFALLPSEVRKDAAHRAQAQYRFTGQQGMFLGRSCETVEIREEDGCVETVCSSGEEFFEGDQKLAPVLLQMGFEPAFVSTLSRYGLGYRLVEVDASGGPKMFAEISRMDPHSIDPSTFAGVCGMP